MSRRFTPQEVAVVFVIVVALGAVVAMSLPLSSAKPSSQSPTLGTAIGRYFGRKTNLLEVRVQLEHPELEQRNIMDNLVDVLHSSPTSLTYRIQVQVNVPSDADPYYHHLWYVDTYAAFSQLLPDMEMHFGNNAGYFAILLRPTVAGAPIVDVGRMLAALFRLNIVDVAVVLCDPIAVAACTVYSSVPFRANRCRDVAPLAVNFFANGAFSQPELFPPKFINLHRCGLRILARAADPFFAYAPRPDNDTASGADADSAHSLMVSGIEGELLKLVAHELNFSVVYDIDPRHQWGGMMDGNDSADGPFDLLERKNVDALIGYFTYAPQLLRHFAESVSHVSSPVVVVVRRKGYHRAAISRTWVLDPFARSTWAHVVWQLVIAVATFNFAKSRYCRQLQQRNPFLKRATWLDIVGTLLGAPRTIVSPNDALCYAILVMRIGLMIFTAAYRGQLYVAYHHVRALLPPTVADVVASNYTFLLRYTVRPPPVFEALHVPAERVVRVDSQEPYPVYDTMRRHSGHVATVASYERFLYYMLRNRQQASFEIVPETIFIQYMCIYFQRHSYLRKPFNRVISKVRSGGLVDKWRNDQYLLLRREQCRYFDTRRHPQALPFAVFKPIFCGLIVCETLTLLVFGAELLLHRCRKHRSLKNEPRDAASMQ